MLFSPPHKRPVVGVICAYLALTLVQASIPLWLDQHYEYHPAYSTCLWHLEDTTGLGKIVYQNVFNFEYYFPIIPVLVSCFITICSLRRGNSGLNRSNRNISVTVTCLTLMYLLFNLPPSVMFLLWMIISNFYPQSSHLYSWDSPHWYFYMFNLTLVVSLNSALNPVLYLWRMCGFRRHLLKLYTTARGKRANTPRSPRTNDFELSQI